MSKRKITFFLSLACLACISCIVICYFYPMQLSHHSERYHVTVMYDDIEIDNFAAFPVGTSTTVVVECSNRYFADIDSAIFSLKYSRCIHTLISDYLPKSEQHADSELIFCDTEDRSVLLNDTGNHVVVDGEVYRISSSSDLYQLCKEAVDNYAALPDGHSVDYYDDIYATNYNNATYCYKYTLTYGPCLELLAKTFSISGAAGADESEVTLKMLRPTWPANCT